MDCPFCKIRDEHCVLLNASARAFRDSFPISEGHTLIIPRKHVASIFDLQKDDLEAIWLAVGEVRKKLQHELNPDGFNIGMNDGEAAGQTVPHAHVHVIPRYADDVSDPRGGIRWILPSKADYWSERP